MQHAFGIPKPSAPSFHSHVQASIFPTQRHTMNRLYLYSVCAVGALGGLLFGYDTAVISGAVGYMSKHFTMTPAMEGWASSCVLLGAAFGAGIAGWLSDRLGRKSGLLFASVCFLVSAAGTSGAPTLAFFVIFRILGGIGVGAASIISPMYIAEITPPRMRGKMVTLNQFAIISGMLIIYFVNYLISNQGTEEWNQTMGWRWMFGSGVFPALLLFCASFFIPESPRWLIANRAAGAAKARKILAKVGGDAYASDELREIAGTVKQESSRISSLLSRPFRIVFLLGIALAVLQQVTGINVFMYYAPEIFKSIVKGTQTDVALLQTIIIGACNMLFTIISFSLVDRLGRKPLMLIGSAGMFLSLTAMGLATYFNRTEGWLLAIILGYIASFSLAVGPVTWVLLSEIFPTRMRGVAMAFATICMWVANYAVSQTFPMLDKSGPLIALFHHALPFWVYAFFCIVLFALVAAYIPETKGKSLEAIEGYWIHRREGHDVQREGHRVTEPS